MPVGEGQRMPPRNWIYAVVGLSGDAGNDMLHDGAETTTPHQSEDPWSNTAEADVCMAVRMQGRIGWGSEPGRYVCCGTHEG